MTRNSTHSRFHLRACPCRPSRPFRGKQYAEHRRACKASGEVRLLRACTHCKVVAPPAEEGAGDVLPEFYRDHADCNPGLISNQGIRQYLNSVWAEYSILEKVEAVLKEGEVVAKDGETVVEEGRVVMEEAEREMEVEVCDDGAPLVTEIFGDLTVKESEMEGREDRKREEEEKRAMEQEKKRVALDASIWAIQQDPSMQGAGCRDELASYFNGLGQPEEREEPEAGEESEKKRKAGVDGLVPAGPAAMYRATADLKGLLMRAEKEKEDLRSIVAKQGRELEEWRAYKAQLVRKEAELQRQEALINASAEVQQKNDGMFRRREEAVKGADARIAEEKRELWRERTALEEGWKGVEEERKRVQEEREKMKEVFEKEERGKLKEEREKLEEDRRAFEEEREREKKRFQEERELFEEERGKFRQEEEREKKRFQEERELFEEERGKFRQEEEREKKRLGEERGELEKERQKLREEEEREKKIREEEERERLERMEGEERKREEDEERKREGQLKEEKLKAREAKIAEDEQFLLNLKKVAQQKVAALKAPRPRPSIVRCHLPMRNGDIVGNPVLVIAKAGETGPAKCFGGGDLRCSHLKFRVWGEMALVSWCNAPLHTLVLDRSKERFGTSGFDTEAESDSDDFIIPKKKKPRLA